MNIIQKTRHLQNRARQYGRARYVAQASNVGFEWLNKFVQGRIKNPGVENIGKLELFFDQVDSENNHTQSQPPALASNDAEPGAGVATN